MRDTTLKIALAGLMHDVGKFAQGSLDVSRAYLANNEGQYQPLWDGRRTHIHATYTAAFIEQMADILPKECNAPGWGRDDSFINLAAGHHNPETPMQWIIAMADRISSGLDRDSFEKGEKIAFQDFKKTRLLPVLESMGEKRCQAYDSADRFQYAYPLSPLSATAIFPEPGRKKDRDTAAEEYRDLFDGFCQQLKELYHRQSNVDLWSEHFDSLLMTWTSHIPAARVGDVVHDVSLYDHCRTTAALAAALYRYHVGSNTFDQRAIRDGAGKKFLLVGGDFYGIQDFIFASPGESGKFRSKLLRGRSFAVSLMTEAAARMLCDALGLPHFSVLLQAAGKFHLLVPNLPETGEKLAQCEEEINNWLFQHTFGQSSMGIAVTEAGPADFQAGGFRPLWDRHLENIEQRKYRKVDLARHGGVVEKFLDSFNNDIDSGKRLCPLCGKRPSDIATRNDPVFRPDDTVSCRLCRDHVYLGANLVKKKMVALCDGDVDGDRRTGLKAPLFDRYQVLFSASPLDEAARHGSLKALWQTGTQEDGSLACRATIRLINGHVPVYREEDNNDDCLLNSARSEGKLEEMIDQIKEGNIKTFSHIAAKARHVDENGKCRGVEALGVLKADVDHLGLLFSCGLTDARFTVSRLATVSRQLNNFFALYLPHLLATTEAFRDVYTVFAGGDDLFLIGPWNRMADLAMRLREEFARYVAKNPEISFSAGITVHKANTPVESIAEASEEALILAKKKKAGEAESKKNRVVMFGQAVQWHDFAELLARRGDMENWLAEKFISDVMFYRFNHLVDMAEKEARLGAMDTITIHDMANVKWPALFRYGLERNVCRGEKRAAALEEVGRAAGWIEKYRGALRIPLWHVLYQKRA